ncbi:hypothetical protein HanPSC8_Chr02g0057491 [Helianthus annuus]|nr:hypothetical protein HanHA89_Chr02g0051621 [Helianthus annuus]KAJ0776762.1 hypothetical protein HanLR1_Chr02g0049371 [Helianthus annuus]KAJ0951224.1 hypothetical protein HanPSC8_Chr02g0057491 [Helianthus annuus]
MSTSSRPEGSWKGKRSKSKDPLRADQAVINWREDEFQQICQNFQFLVNWGAQYPTPGSTALDAPPGYITLYGAFFRKDNFRLPITKFFGEVLTRYGLHVSHISPVGMPWVTHFEFICQAQL